MIATLTPEPTLADTAYERIEAMIVTLQLQPGSVFSEGDLSQAMGIGRTPLREALQRLAADGLVTSIPRRGMMIAPIDLTEMLSVIEARKVLDRLVVAGAAERASGADRSAISLALEAMASEPEGFMQADYRLDKAIAAACPNKFAVQACRPLHTHCRRFWFKHRENEDLKRSAELHRLMVEAILNGDKAAAVERSDKLLDYLTLFTKHILIAG